jgi:hypothetical protein
MYEEYDLNDIKKLLYNFYYCKEHRKRYDECWGDGMAKKDLEGRKLIITEVKGDYGKISAFVFSVCGSPPKGEAIFFINGGGDDKWFGCLSMIGIESKFKTLKFIYIKGLKEKKV